MHCAASSPTTLPLTTTGHILARRLLSPLPRHHRAAAGAAAGASLLRLAALPPRQTTPVAARRARGALAVAAAAAAATASSANRHHNPLRRALSSSSSSSSRAAHLAASSAGGVSGSAAAMPPLSPPPAAAAPTTAAATTATATTANVTVFTTQACPYCRKAKALLQSRGVPYREVDVELGGTAAAEGGQARALRAAVAGAAGGRRTVPQIFVGSAHVGGSDDLAAADLGALLASPEARGALPAELEAAMAAAAAAVAAGAAAAGAGGAGGQRQAEPLTLVDRAEPDVRAAYATLLAATAATDGAPSARTPALAALAAARRGGWLSSSSSSSPLTAAERWRREVPQQSNSSSDSCFPGADPAAQRRADALYAASLADPDADEAPDDGAFLYDGTFSGAELVAALTDALPAEGGGGGSGGSGGSGGAGGAGGGDARTTAAALAMARRLVLSNLVNVVSARRPDPRDARACASFFDELTPRKRLRLLEDTLAEARRAAGEDAAAGQAAGSSSPGGPQLPLFLEKLLRLSAAGAAGASGGRRRRRPAKMGASPLNAPFWWAGPARPAARVAEDLRARVVRLYDAHLRLEAVGPSSNGAKNNKDSNNSGNDGNDGSAAAAAAAPPKTVVAYGALRRDRRFWDEYVSAATELQAVSDLSSLSPDALSALAINLYNALVVHGLAVYGPERALGSAARRLAFFQKGARYLIGGGGGGGGNGGGGDNTTSSTAWGGLLYTCDDLEHGVLRGNRPGAAAPTMLLGLGLAGQALFAPFKAGDPRRAAVVPPPPDARLHFALVCGAASCPPIRTYSASTLDEGLAAAAEAFCASAVRVDEIRAKIWMSKIFGWYYPDFGDSKGARLAWLLPHLPPAKREALGRMLARDPSARSIEVEYDPYDWAANAAEE